MIEKPKAIDLFCGCGGLTLGLKQAGFDVIGAIDIDPLAVETYKLNHPEVYLWKIDIKDLTSGEIKKTLNLEKGKLDLLAGCPPCQGFSTMRTLNGGRKIKDKRNDLIFEFLRFVKDFEPKSIMMENVPGLINDARFRKFCKEIETLGYIPNYEVENTVDYGVPQRRRRTILLAGKGFKIDFAETIKKKVTVADAIKRMPKVGQSGDPLHDIHERRSDKVKRLIAMIPKDGGSRMDLPPEEQLDSHFL
jgi:DNA (cytosine-5)-methyltransferase 1